MSVENFDLLGFIQNVPVNDFTLRTRDTIIFSDFIGHCQVVCKGHHFDSVVFRIVQSCFEFRSCMYSPEYVTPGRRQDFFNRTHFHGLGRLMAAQRQWFHWISFQEIVMIWDATDFRFAEEKQLGKKASIPC